ncbi:MAG: hypothetical protein AAF621_03980 [Pseudomonadota bacterium]
MVSAKFLDNLKSNFVPQLIWGYFITACIAVIAIGYDLITSWSYWHKWLNFFSEGRFLFIDFTHFTVTIGLIILPLFGLRKLQIQQKENWINKVSYNFSDHMNGVIQHLLSQYSNVSSKTEFSNLIKDTLDQVYLVYKQENNAPIITWMAPDKSNNILHLKAVDKYNAPHINIQEYYSFKCGEGVAGNSWKNGKVEFYAPQQENILFSQRSGCENSAYMCCPIGNKPLSKHGIIGIGFENTNKKIFTDYEISGLQLLSTAIEIIFEKIDDEYKVW